MIQLEIYQQVIVVGYDNTIVFVNAENGKVSAVQTYGCRVRNRRRVQAQAQDEDEGIDLSPNLEPEIDEEEQAEGHVNLIKEVQLIKVSPNNEFLAVTFKGLAKFVHIYKQSSEKFDILSATYMPRTSSAITFSNDSKYLLVCDKSGDCHLFDCMERNAPGKLILGHLSIVLDVIFTPDNKHIITCDRDEKIRVTKYPDTHEIECYCLGHEEFVSSISLLPIKKSNDSIIECDYYLLSLSGDKTMKIWNYTNGQQIDEIQLEAPGIKHTVHQINDDTWHIAIILYQSNENVCVYELKQIKDNLYESKLISKHDFDSKIVKNICFNRSNGKLYLILIENRRIELGLLQYDNKSHTYAINDELPNLKTSLNLLSEYQPTESNDVSLWFKKKFDNVSEYLERKKRRIEERNSSK